MSSFALKIIALVTMLIDHIGFLGQGILGFNHPYSMVFDAMRCIGRVAMPLFIFMVAEGCMHTHDIKKYIRSLFIFAIISEIPFDIFVNSSGEIMQYNAPRIYTFGMQNVYFTLMVGAIAIFLYQIIIKTKFKYLAILPVIPLMAVAEFMNTDYGWFGVLGILFVYIMPNKYLKMLALVLVPLVSRWNMPVEMLFGITAILLVFFYNGERGRNTKWIFYWFYPTHLAFLAMLVSFVGRYIVG